MAGKITDYPTTTSLIDEDLFDLSKYDGVSAYATNAIKWEDILKEIQIDLTFNNLYNNNGTIGTGRTATLTDSLSFVSGQVIAAASAAGYASLNIPSGADPTVPVDGDLWFNGTNLYFRDGGTSVDLLSGGGIYGGSGSIITNTTASLATNNLAFSTTGEPFMLMVNGTTNQVGIGKNPTTVGFALDVDGTIGFNGVVKPHTNVTGEKFVAWDNGAFGVYGLGISGARLATEIYAATNGGNITFGKGNEAAFTEYARFVSSGNFGIGTTAPTEKLDIVGNTTISQRLGVGAAPQANATSYVLSIASDLYGQRIIADNLTANGFGLNVRSTSATNNTGIYGQSTTSGAGVEAAGVWGASIAPNGSNHYGVTGRAKNGSSFTYGVDGRIESGASVVSSSRTAAVRGLNSNSNSNNNYGGYLQSNSTSGTSYGVAGIANGAATTNYGGHFSASGASNNYALVTNGGNVGIGTITPTDNLQVVGNLNATRYKVNGVAGANFSGAVTNITVVDGIVTAVS